MQFIGQLKVFPVNCYHQLAPSYCLPRLMLQLSVSIYGHTLFNHSLLTNIADAAISIGVKHFNHHLVSLQKFTDETGLNCDY